MAEAQLFGIISFQVGAGGRVRYLREGVPEESTEKELGVGVTVPGTPLW